MSIRALLVDDEPLVRERLRDLLAGHADIEIVGECGDGLSALEAGSALAPDVVFLDIRMPGLSGLEVAAAWHRGGWLPLIVFVTAYDEFAIEAFRVNALDYLTKPIDPVRLTESLERVRAWRGRPPHEGPSRRGAAHDDLSRRVAALLESFERERGVRPNVLVKTGDRYRLVPTAEIHAIEAAGNYACVHCADANHILRTTLSALEATLDPREFVRVHRSWIVNLRHVREIETTENGSWRLRTRGGGAVPVGAQYRDALQRLIG